MFNGAHILVAPLDWGLGHGARCIPIIQRLLGSDARVVIGADRGPLALLRDAFPALPWVRLPGAIIHYAKGSSQTLAMAAQFPALLRSMRAEHQHLLNLRRSLALDAVISDQRFGLRADGLPSVLITHQVFPFTPLAQGFLRRYNLQRMALFDRCWIPDDEDAPGLAGELSHGPRLPQNVRYIGPLSRMDASTAIAPTEDFRIVCVISGPEPHRTLLENELLAALHDIPGKHLLVRGYPEAPVEETIGNVRRVGHLDGPALTGAMLRAELIVSRAGYTTLMDLDRIGRSALLIPTPGQPEQEYLGRLHAGTGRFLIQTQGALDPARALASDVIRTKLPMIRDHNARFLDEAMNDLAGSIRTHRK